MHKSKLRSRLARAATLGVVAAAASLTLGATTASAAPADPTGFTPPHFYNGNVEGIRDSGSDTTFFMMQKIGDLFTGGGLYGCVLNTGAGQTLFNVANGGTDPASSTTNQQDFCQASSNISTTDTADNWDRTEVTEGVDDVGSGAGQSQVCGAINTPLPVDFARSSKPAGTACSTMVQTGYAKDGVPIVSYPITPAQFGTSSSTAYGGVNGGSWGPVASGWLPGDPTAGPFTGTKLTSISNGDNGGGANSTAFRLWCATNTTRITDWGQLTNLGPQLQVQGVQTTNGSTTITLTSGTWPSTVGNGDAITGPGIPASDTISGTPSGATATLATAATAAGTITAEVTTASNLASGQGLPVGIPVRLMGVNTASGTESTFTSYANSGVSGTTGCSSNMNTNAASDPNSATANGTNTGPHVALENNSDQINQFAVGDWPSPDFVDQAIEVSTTLYIESNGVFNTNPFAAASTINGITFSAFKLNMNGVSATTPALLSNSYPTARTLFNIYNTATVRASTGGFLNWICDGGVNFLKGEDNSTGKNFDTELNTIISSNFGFPRLTDTSAAATTSTPADGIAAPNNSCAAALSVTTTSGSPTITLTAGGNFPVDIPNAGGLAGKDSDGSNNALVTGAGIPSGTFVSSGSGTGTLTLSQNATASGTAIVVFSGVPAVTSVTNPQT